MRRLALLLPLALGFLAIVALPSAAGAAGREVTGLRVSGGNVWHAENRFFLEWDPPGPDSEVLWTLVADATPGILASGEDPERWNAIGVQVPPVPGLYWFQATDWLLHSFGPESAGPPVRVPLYFDDARPRPVSIAAPAWVAAGTVVPIRLSHPAAPLPISGITGYAVSIDGAAEGVPCARADRCAAGEVDLAGGVGQDVAGHRVAGHAPQV